MTRLRRPKRYDVIAGYKSRGMLRPLMATTTVQMARIVTRMLVRTSGVTAKLPVDHEMRLPQRRVEAKKFRVD